MWPYRYRPPYPAETFTILSGLITGKPGAVLDIGCGTGYLARPLAQLVQRVDAVDFSPHMIDQGRHLPGGDAPNLNWIGGAVEEVILSPPYDLVTAGESLHWMNWQETLPRIHHFLLPGGFLAIVSKRFSATLWHEALNRLIARFSTNQDYEPYDLATELTQRGLFSKQGERETAPVSFRKTVAARIESIHSTNGFSRQRVGPKVADEFDTAVHALITPHCPDGTFEIEFTGHVVWGIPHAI